MEAQLIPFEQIKDHLADICRIRIAEIIKRLEAYEYIKRDRGLWMHEIRDKNSWIRLLKTNEDILEAIDSEYSKVQ